MRFSSPLPVLVCSAALLGGCIEYQPGSNLEPLGAPNPREIANGHQTDALIQANVPQVDVLWLVDNSSSMGEEQAGIAQNFPTFLNFFLGSGLDYHIGVISTDMEDPAHRGRLVQRQGVRYITPITPFALDVIQDMTRLGTGGSGNEKGRDPIYHALELERDGYNEGFFRSSADLHIVVISDEEDSSEEISEPEFIQWLRALKSGTKLSFSSIVTPELGCPTGNDPGVEYLRYTAAIGGIEWSICDDQWDQVLELLGIQAASLEREYFLSKLPVQDTIEVLVTQGNTTFAFPGEDWAYNEVRNSVIFAEYVPDPGSVISIEYDVLRESEL